MKNKIIEECIERMKLLKISSKCISEFKKGIIWESEGIGALYELNEKEQNIVKEFEEEHKDYKVYHLIHNYTEFGELYSLLYVNTEEKEWIFDRNDLKNGYAFVYVKNLDDEYSSEFGSIRIKPSIGGLVRLA